MGDHSMEHMSNGDIEDFYLFLDTNILYNPKVSYDIFKTKLMNDLLDTRNSFNKVFSDYRSIKILIPKLSVDEIYSLKASIIQLEINEFQRKIKHLEEKRLVDLLENISSQIYLQLETFGNAFFSSNDIEIIPYCNNDFFPTIIEKSINKHLPFKPKYDPKKKRYVGDNGFKDAVIWYSIINYAKKECNPKTDHIFLLTNNEKDFKSNETLLEFKQLTEMDIEIITLKKDNPNINDSEFNSFLSNILHKSQTFVPPVKIEQINISYLQLQNRVEINSIFTKPLSININAMINCKKVISNLEDGNRQILNKKIEDRLSEFRFDISNLKFNYYTPKIDNIFFVLVNDMGLALNIDQICITYDDGTEVNLYDELNVVYNDDHYCLIDFEQEHEQFIEEAIIIILDYLEDKGYEVIADEIEFDYGFSNFIL